jgi:hypothetical protein
LAGFWRGGDKRGGAFAPEKKRFLKEVRTAVIKAGLEKNVGL